MTALLLGIKADWLRVPLWAAWYPSLMIDFVVDAIAAGEWRRLLETECWETLFAFYIVGLDGWED